jgi:RND family efflux transporter MFP subunit
VLAEVDEAFVGRVQLGRNVRVHVAAYPGEAFSGTVNYIGETINPKTRRVTVRCQVPNTDGRLKPEMYANVEIGEGDPHELVAVPTGAVQTMHGQSSVFVAEADGRFRARVVDIGSERDGLVEVRTGLRAGERVVTSGAFVLKSELLKTGAGTEN